MVCVWSIIKADFSTEIRHVGIAYTNRYRLKNITLFDDITTNIDIIFMIFLSCFVAQLSPFLQHENLVCKTSPNHSMTLAR
jgi:hypothetical protein